jgi:hypothetical protein
MAIVGTMWCAYVFAVIALVGLPAVLGSSLVPARFSSPVLWVSSEFRQLVLLAVIIVGQNIQQAASDQRAQMTYDDTVAIQQAAVEIHELLACTHSAPQTWSCPGRPDLAIPASAY